MEPPRPSSPPLTIVVELARAQVGGAATLTQLLGACREAVESRGPDVAQTMRAVAAQLRWFAGVQIRNVATLAGNIVTGSPISDLNPLWVASGATFVMASAARGERPITAGDFFLAYRCVRTARPLCFPVRNFSNKLLVQGEVAYSP